MRLIELKLPPGGIGVIAPLALTGAARPGAVILPSVPGRSSAAPGFFPPDPGARWLPDTDEVDADGVP